MTEPDNHTGRAEQLAAKVGDLPAMPDVAARVMQVIAEPKTTAMDLERLIGTDQATAAKVLRIANSAFYGVRGEINTLSRAVVVIGFNTIRSIVLTGVSEALHAGRRSNFKDRILWEHSISVALAARTIARECRYDSPEEAYVGGLLHDIGKVVMDANLGDEYLEVIERVYNEGDSFIDAENEVLGFDHTDVGVLVAQRWTLAPTLQEAVRFHHEPMGADLDPTLCAIVSLANSVCHSLGLAPQRDAEVELESLESTLMLTLDPGRLSQIAEAVATCVAEEKSQLSIA